MARCRVLTNPFSFKEKINVDIENLLPKRECLDLEIGFGRGVFINSYAKKYKDRNIIGLDIRKFVVDECNEKFKNQGFDNVLFLLGEANICLDDMFKNNSIDKIFIFHPDPWAKTKHRKRRLIQKDFLDRVFKKLKSDGRMYITTDVEELWTYMSKTIKEHNKFKTVDDEYFFREDYVTDWHSYSVKQDKNIFFGAFEKI